MLQTFIFSATLTLPIFMKMRLRKGGGGSGGGASTLENLMNRWAGRLGGRGACAPGAGP